MISLEIRRRLLLVLRLKALEGDTSEIGVPSIMKLVEAMDNYIPDTRTCD